MTPQISIIIPVYNSASTIEKCVNSIMKQDFKDYEVLLVNDGSVDKSMLLMQQMAAQDRRIVSIDKKHEGVSAARNMALEKARGNYVCFIDADDTVESNYLSVMYEHRDADMVICGYYVDWMSADGVLQKQEKHLLTQKGMFDISKGCDVISELFKNGKIHINCNKLLKKSIVDANQIRYKPIPVNEDYMFMVEYLKHANTVYACENMTYHWVREDGRTTGVNSLPDNLIDIYIQAYDDTNVLFCNKELLNDIFYFTFEFVCRKYLIAEKSGCISKQTCYRELQRMFRLPQVKQSWNYHKCNSLGEYLMHVLPKYRLWGIYKKLFINDRY